MLKKISMIPGMVIVFSNSVFAGEGFYLGLGLGPENADFKQKAHIARPRDFDTIDKTHHAGKGGFGSLFGGYEYRFSKCGSECRCGSGCKCGNMLSLAGELNLDISSVKFKSFNNEFLHQNFNKAAYKMRHSFGASLLPGIVITNCTLLYARLGYVSRKFKLQTTEITLPSTDRTRSGFRYGLGIKQDITDHFALRLDYSETAYKRVKIFGVDTSSNVTKNTSIRPLTRKFEIGFVYTWC